MKTLRITNIPGMSNVSDLSDKKKIADELVEDIRDVCREYNARLGDYALLPDGSVQIRFPKDDLLQPLKNSLEEGTMKVAEVKPSQALAAKYKAKQEEGTKSSA